MVLVVLALSACGAAPGPAAKKTEAKAEAKAEVKAEGPKLAAVREDVPVPLPAFLGKDSAAAEAQLEPPLGKGTATESCVRFVPERVFFACKRAFQRYGDRTGTFAAVHLEIEDGVVTGIGYEGWKAGHGPVSPAPLLAAVGLELPEEPLVDSPEPGVRRWSWFNHLARLPIGGRQYRVEMSVVGDDWAHSKLSVILNDPLTEAQKAATLQVKDPAPAP